MPGEGAYKHHFPGEGHCGGQEPAEVRQVRARPVVGGVGWASALMG